MRLPGASLRLGYMMPPISGTFDTAETHNLARALEGAWKFKYEAWSFHGATAERWNADSQELTVFDAQVLSPCAIRVSRRDVPGNFSNYVVGVAGDTLYMGTNGSIALQLPSESYVSKALVTFRLRGTTGDEMSHPSADLKPRIVPMHETWAWKGDDLACASSGGLFRFKRINERLLVEEIHDRPGTRFPSFAEAKAALPAPLKRR